MRGGAEQPMRGGAAAHHVRCGASAAHRHSRRATRHGSEELHLRAVPLLHTSDGARSFHHTLRLPMQVPCKSLGHHKPMPLRENCGVRAARSARDGARGHTADPRVVATAPVLPRCLSGLHIGMHDPNHTLMRENCGECARQSARGMARGHRCDPRVFAPLRLCLSGLLHMGMEHGCGHGHGAKWIVELVWNRSAPMGTVVLVVDSMRL